MGKPIVHCSGVQWLIKFYFITSSVRFVFIVLLISGLTVREALQKPIKHSNLSPNDLIVYQYGDPYKRPISWDSDISQIGCGSLKMTLGVELEDNSKKPKSHDFVLTEFKMEFGLMPVMCKKCRRALFSVSINIKQSCNI